MENCEYRIFKRNIHGLKQYKYNGWMIVRFDTLDEANHYLEENKEKIPEYSVEKYDLGLRKVGEFIL